MAQQARKAGLLIFQNRWVERLTRTHIAVPLVIFYGIGLCIAAYVLSQGTLNLASVAVILTSGMLVFSLFEYLVHRHLFHIQSALSSIRRLRYLFHGVHHETPRDPHRLAMPPIVSLAISASLLSLFHWVAGYSGLVFGGGFLMGYATYLMVHYAVHRMKPPKNQLRILWRHHSIHHYKDDGVAFGVSSPLWDYVFGTMPPRRDPR